MPLRRRLLGHGPVDNGDGCAECGLYIQKRGIQQVGISRLEEAAIGIGHVSGVPFLYLVIEGVAVNHLAARLELASPALHAGLAVGGDEEFHIGVGRYPGADVAAIEHGTACLERELSLEIEQRFAHPGDNGHLARHLTDLAAGENIGIELGRIDRARRRDREGLETRIGLATRHGSADGAVEQPGVQVRQAVVAGEAGREGALSRCRGPIHCNDHGKLRRAGPHPARAAAGASYHGCRRRDQRPAWQPPAKADLPCRRPSIFGLTVSAFRPNGTIPSGRPPPFSNEEELAKDQRGTKREDPDTGKKFYDLNKDPIVSPYTGKSYPRSFFDQNVVARAKAAPERTEDDEDEEVEVEEAADANAPEIVSLEDADAEEAGAEGEEIPDVEDVEDVEDLGDDDADVFLEEDEDEDEDLDFDVGGGDER